MTKHRQSFAQGIRKDTPDAEALVSFVNRWRFIVATPRTKALLDVLAKAGVLKRNKRGKLWRYTPST